ncbi:MAG TPA: aldo/keto reductase [Gemmatimonadaceae bacterium]|nr:aldo/keto reductase [Gemmatimonadaceae bacterium]
MIDRRMFFGFVAGATLAISPQLLSAQQLSGKLIERAIPSTGEKLPVIGLAFSNHPSCADHAALKEVVKTFADNGGRYFDATLGNAANQKFHATAANELGVANKFFWSTTAFQPGPGSTPAGVKTQIDSVLARTKASKLDLAWVTAAGPPEVLAILKEEKKAGRVRYIGVMTIVEQAQAAQLEALMRNEPIDFIGVGYDIGNRFVEDKILPLALEKKIGVVAFFPFGNNSGVSCGALSLNLFARVGNRPLPEWAAEFDAKTWSHFFTKYVISHPAITVARVGTTKAHHMLDNLGGGIGRLPNEATRKRMADLIETFPKPTPPARAGGPPGGGAQAPGIAVSVAILDRYVGEYRNPASGTIFAIRREGDKLFVKPGTMDEAPLNARSEIRFQDPRGPTFEFQLDAQGKVTGAILEQQGPQGPQRIALERK